MHGGSQSQPNRCPIDCCSLVSLLQQGAIASAGGGSTQNIVDRLAHKSALALRSASGVCRDVIRRGWHAHALSPGRHLTAALHCFPAMRELLVDRDLVAKVSESECLRLIESGAWRCRSCCAKRVLLLAELSGGFPAGIIG
jgi:hypothetical protein